ncbi:MAG: response regulator [Ignavibacteriales bacterium]|nr:response regulator [Ignavibacteriales bacterium]
MQIQVRVLVVDDSDHVRILVSKLLKQRDFLEIDTAPNGKVALEKIKSFRPDIIFLDAIMPEIGGLEVLQTVKKESPGIIVVMMSSISAREEILQFKEAGVDFYILKPFETQKFDEVLDKAFTLLSGKKEG